MTLLVVVRDERFEEELMLLLPGAVRADEVLEAVEWVLARSPREGFDYGNGIWALDTAEYALVEPMTIFYTFDAETVTLLSIRRYQPTGED